jgi:hypothetical protein
VLDTDIPFPAAARVEPWTAQLITLFDGQTAAHAVYQAALERRLIEPRVGLEDFMRLVAELISRQFLEVDQLDFEVP